MKNRWWRQARANYPMLTGLVSTALGLTMLALGAWEPVDRSAHNTLFQMQTRWHPLAWDDRIAIVAIDEASLAEYGRFPWRRDRYADFLAKLLPVQPAAIGFDFILTEATADDAAFADHIGLSGNVVLAVGDDGAGNALGISPTITAPAAGAFLLGHVKTTPDADGISRQVRLYEGQFPSLGVALLSMYHTSLGNTLGVAAPQLSPMAATVLANPQAFNQPLWLNWPGSSPNPSAAATGLTVLSFRDVMEGRVDLSQLQNKIVLVGVTAAGIDPLRTPLQARIPTAGVYYHAVVLDNLLGDRFLRRWPAWAIVGLVIGFSISTSLVLSRLGPKVRLGLLLSLVPLGLGMAYLGLLHQVWIPIAAPMGTGLISALGLQFAEQRERKSLMDLLALNTSRAMADLMWLNKAELLEEGQIQPRELTATVLFTDIRNFTQISESLPSAVLLPWLNRYFEVMTDCIMAAGGVVDKYIGDAIMAVFGAPLPHTQPEEIQQDAIAAVRAALAMHQRLQHLNQEFAEAGLPNIRFGVGIH
ncbi:MAG: adenylate/guanylate cyclase domain-containing protein, partial [Nodosilinea sp.]